MEDPKPESASPPTVPTTSAPPKASGVFSAQEERLARREEEVAERERAAGTREEAVSHQEQVADKRDLELNRRERIAEKRAEELDHRKHLIDEREAGFTSREEGLKQRERSVALREEAHSARDLGLAERERAAFQRERGIAEREEALARREDAFARRDDALAKREAGLVRREDELVDLEDAARHAAIDPRTATLENITRPDEIDAAWCDPRSLIALEIIHRLMDGGDEKLFYSSQHGKPPDYRVTAFWPVAMEAEERLYPFLRGEFAQQVRLCPSRLYFLPGELYAGEAWRPSVERAPGAPVMNLERLPALVDCDGDEDAWRRAWQAQGVPSRITQQMSGANAYAREVRSVACVAVQSQYGDIVFCVDSHRPDAFDKRCLTQYAKDHFDLQRPFGRLLDAIHRRVDSHRDFGSWFESAFQGKARWLATVITLIGPVLALLWSLLKDAMGPHVPAALATLPALVQAWGPLAGAAVYLLAGWCLLPTRANLSTFTLSRLKPQLRLFVSAWYSLLVFECGAWLVFGLNRLLPPALNTYGLLDAAGTLFASGAAYASFAAYRALIPEGKSADADAASPTDREKLAFLLAAVVAMAFTFTNHVYLARGIIGSIAAVTSALVIARLSELGPPRKLVALLYLGVIVRLFCVIAPTEQAAHFYALRLPLDALSFLVVAWSIRGVALERFLLRAGRFAEALRNPGSTGL